MEKVVALFRFLTLLFVAVSAFGRPIVSSLKTNRTLCSSTPAIFVFGDSTVDSGNNNYIPTTVRSDFPPYGRDFPGHPTGRFTNGKFTTDFFASHIGLKDMVPPYLDSTLSAEELETGVSFASAGSGLDPLTAQLTLTIPLDQQLEYFKKYLAKQQDAVGREKIEDIVSRASFTISSGAVDFILNYFPLPIRQIMYSVKDYRLFLLKNIKEFIEELLKLGAKNIVVVGLPPLGCVPLAVTFYRKQVFGSRSCIESYNTIAKDYNADLQKELEDIQNRSRGVKIAYADTYSPILDMVTSPAKYGFSEALVGCCGTGVLEAGISCNPLSPVCGDSSKFVFWDAVHPTEKAYYHIFQSFLPMIEEMCGP